MNLAQKFAIGVSCAVTLAALWLVVDRSGLIAWVTLVAGVMLVLKIWLRPSRLDVAFATLLAVTPVALWFATFYYVIAQWESGQVVELEIDTAAGSETARLWVLDIDANPVVYYDAAPAAAEALLAGKPLRFTRQGVTTTRIPDGREESSVPPEEAEQIFTAMAEKYGALNGAADLYYLMLGRSRDRVGVVAILLPPT